MVNVPDFNEPVDMAIHCVLHTTHDTVSMSVVYTLSFSAGTVRLESIRMLAGRATIEKFLANFSTARFSLNSFLSKMSLE